MATRTLLLPGAPGGGQQIVRFQDGSLSARGRAAVWLLAAVLLLTGGTTLAALGITPLTGGAPADGGAGGSAVSADAGTTGAAAGSTAASATDTDDPDDLIQARWDGPTTHLDWAGRGYATVEASFVGDRVASPGDRVQRTLLLTNAGPSGAVLSVELTAEELVPEIAANPELASAVELFWDVAGVTGREAFATLVAAGSQPVAEAQVAAGQEVAVTVGFEMPADVTTEMSQSVASTVLSFGVRAHMEGDTTDPGVLPGSEVPVADLAVTGAQIGALLALVAALVLVGWLLVGLARRRAACEDCGRRRAAADEWVTRRDADGTRHHTCGPCDEQRVAAQEADAGLARDPA